MYRYIGCNTLRLAVRADRTAVAFDENAPQVWLLRVQVGAQAALAAGCPVFLLAADRQPAPQIAQAVRRIIRDHDAVREVLL